MNIQSECIICLIKQIEKALDVLQISYSNDQIVALQKKIMGKFSCISELSMPYYSQAVYNEIALELNNSDPYLKLKRDSTNFALSLIPQIESLIATSNNPLSTLVLLSIMGNTIDFGTPHKIDLRKDIEEFSFANLAINDYPQLEKEILKAKKIMIVGDNAGESVFDLLLIKYLKLNYPEKIIIYSVRGGPAINDVTLGDIKDLDFEKYCCLVEGSKCPGVIFNQTSKEFQFEFKTADVILSKGQGNFESLDDINDHSGLLFYLLKVKCHVVANLLKIPIGKLVILKK